jgi:hypothetical protein
MFKATKKNYENQNFKKRNNVIYVVKINIKGRAVQDIIFIG